MITLSVRQPWAWLIVNGYKDIENRDWKTSYRGAILIHAGKTMARVYYDSVLEHLATTPGIPADILTKLPHYEQLERGGIVGVSEIAGCVESSDSPWFMGPYGFLMRNSRPLPFHAVNGQLNFFDVRGVQIDA